MPKRVDFNEPVVISGKSNLLYFSGLDNEEARLLIVGNRRYYFCDAAYITKNCPNTGDLIVKDFSELGDAVRKEGLDRVGVEQKTIAHELHVALAEAGIKQFWDATNEIRRRRAIKTDEEIALIERAQRITDKTFADVLANIKEGMTETETLNLVNAELALNGAKECAFDTLVGFDESTGAPHAAAGDRKLKCGTLVMIDFGAKFEKYCSDMTRTFFFGKADAEYVKIYSRVLKAQTLSMDAARAGMTGRQCDEVARGYFRECGLDRHFAHSLGHGVGIDIHEAPFLSALDGDMTLEKNMVATFEPGLYFKGEFGIRIEDMAVIADDGIANLTKTPKDLLIV